MSQITVHSFKVRELIEPLELPEELKRELISKLENIFQEVIYVVESGSETYLSQIPIPKFNDEVINILTGLRDVRLSFGGLIKTGENYNNLTNVITCINDLKSKIRDRLSDITNAIFEELKLPEELKEQFLNILREKLTTFIDPIKAYYEALKEWKERVKQTLEKTVESLEEIRNVVEQVKQKVEKGERVSVIQTIFAEFDKCVEEKIKTGLDELGAVAECLAEFLWKIFWSLILKFVTPVVQFIQDIWNRIQNFFIGVTKWFEGIFPGPFNWNFIPLGTTTPKKISNEVIKRSKFGTPSEYNPEFSRITVTETGTLIHTAVAEPITFKVFIPWKKGEEVYIDILCITLNAFLKIWDDVVNAFKERKPITWSIFKQKIPDEEIVYAYGTFVYLDKDGVIEYQVRAPFKEGEYVIMIDCYKEIGGETYSSFAYVVVGEEPTFLKTPFTIDPDEENVNISFSITNTSTKDTVIRVAVEDLEEGVKESQDISLKSGETKNITITAKNVKSSRWVKVTLHRVIASKPGSLDITSLVSIDVVKIIPKRVKPGKPEVPKVTNIELVVTPTETEVCKEVAAYATFYFEHACTNDFKKTVDWYVNNELVTSQEVTFIHDSDVQVIEATLHFVEKGEYNVKVCCKEDNVCSNTVEVTVKEAVKPLPKVEIVEVMFDKSVYESGDVVKMYVKVRSEEEKFHGKVCMKDRCTEFYICKSFEMTRGEKIIEFKFEAPKVTEETKCEIELKLLTEEDRLLGKYMTEYIVKPKVTPPPPSPKPKPSIELVELTVLDPKPWVYCPILDAVTVRVGVTLSEPVEEDTSYIIRIFVEKNGKVIREVRGTMIIPKGSVTGIRDFVIRNIGTIGKVSIYATDEEMKTRSTSTEIDIMPPIVCRIIKLIQKGKIYGEIKLRTT